jgi:hypothetical protein
MNHGKDPIFFNDGWDYGKKSRKGLVAISLVISLIATLLVAIPTFAWHVDIDQCTTPGTQSAVIDAGYEGGIFTYPGHVKVVNVLGIKGTEYPLPGGDYTYEWGREKQEFTLTSCPSLVRNPSARIIGPCGDPNYGAVLNNVKSDLPSYFVITFDGQKVKRTVGPGNKVVVGPFYVHPFKTIIVRTQAGKVLAREQAAVGGSYGWGGECSILR